ncbi:hypothetical protein PV433_23860 [Paenibacillus sp. GYB004]|uniref:hypothetical protein n=1 Tax=Paenibacillus sp. GYB004 TaxID=2994393 RepID=UPI002F96542F
MDRTDCSLLICGATFAGLGAAAAAREAGRNVVVVERSASVGREFIEAMNPGSGWRDPDTDFGRNLKREWLRRNVMEEGGPAHLPALHPLLCHLIKQSGLQVRFLTEIVGVKERDGQYEVMLHDASGCTPLLVREIADTTSERLTVPGRLTVPPRKRLNAYLHHPDPSGASIPAPFDDRMSVVRGRFSSEMIVKVEVDPGDSWLQARQYLHQYWRARPEEWASWTIASVAGCFESDVPTGLSRLGAGWSWQPSEAYSNPLAAIDRGYDMYRKGEVAHDAAKAN